MEQYWDPLRKKNVAATPEEKVRQWFISVLRDSCAVPVGLMMSEAGFRFGNKQYRADILVSGRDGNPLAIVECKRPDVELTEEVALQAMRYNAVLSVRLIVLTNGRSTLVFRNDEGVFRRCDRMLSYDEMSAL